MEEKNIGFYSNYEERENKAFQNAKTVLEIAEKYKNKQNNYKMTSDNTVTSNTINQAFTEVYDIILHFEKNIYKKIPKKFLNMIEQNRDLKYKVDIDYSKDINDQNLLKDTRAILALIYRDYLCSPEEKNELIKQDKEELLREEEKKREKYNTDNLFKKDNNMIVEKNYNVEIVEYKESLWKKIWNKILSFIKK